MSSPSSEINPLVQLIYISAPVGDSSTTVSEFVPVALMMNKQFAITGLVISSDTFFLQVIEGPREQINTLYANIVRDKRHEKPVLLRYSELAIREFADWSMTHTTHEELQTHYLLPKKLPAVVSPSTLSGLQATALLRRVAVLLRTDELLTYTVDE